MDSLLLFIWVVIRASAYLWEGDAFAFVDYRCWRTQRMAVIIEEL